MTCVISKRKFVIICSDGSFGFTHHVYAFRHTCDVFDSCHVFFDLILFLHQSLRKTV